MVAVIESFSEGVNVSNNQLNYPGIYSWMMQFTDGDHEISDEAACWCETANAGDVYEFREGIIEIMDFDKKGD